MCDSLTASAVCAFALPFVNFRGRWVENRACQQLPLAFSTSAERPSASVAQGKKQGLARLALTPLKPHKT